MGIYFGMNIPERQKKDYYPPFTPRYGSTLSKDDQANAEDDNDEIVFPNIDLYTFAYGDSLDDKDLIIASYHTQLKTELYAEKNINRLELSFHGVWRHEDRKPLLNKKRHYRYSQTDLQTLSRYLGRNRRRHFQYTFPHVPPTITKTATLSSLTAGLCAWMIGLPHKIGQSDIPDTAEVIDIDGKNTLVVSNRDEWFTSFNAEHVQKANFFGNRIMGKRAITCFLIMFRFIDRKAV